MEKTWCVYVHINKFNGKRYVGITSKPKPEQRWESGAGYTQSPRFYSAIKKYGWDGFEHVVLVSGIPEESAKKDEEILIRLWHTQDLNYGYNLTSGGEGTPGYHPSDATRRKLSEARRKENLSAETLKRRSDGLRGRKFSDDHKKKIGDANSKKINMFDADGNFIRSFRCAYDAEVELGISHSHISQCCHGHRKTAGGYTWSFA